MLRRCIPPLVVMALALAGAKQATAGLTATTSLSGPLTNLSFCTPYRYRVRITPSRSYAHALVSLSSPITSGYVKPRSAHLVAHQTWIGTFTVVFSPLRRELTSTLNLGVSVPPPHHGYVGLAGKRSVLAFGTLPPASPQPPCAPPSYFGS
jgi:hypothetical protein